MKCKSDRRPSEYEIRRGNKMCLIIFSTNVKENTVTNDEGESETEYDYDRYELIVPYRDTLEQDVKSQPEKWLEKAKQNEIDILSSEIRNKRNELLAESDSAFCIDRIFNDMSNISTTALSAKFKELANSDIAKYRQQLRDIPQQDGFPYNVTFPAKPEM